MSARVPLRPRAGLRGRRPYSAGVGGAWYSTARATRPDFARVLDGAVMRLARSLRGAEPVPPVRHAGPDYPGAFRSWICLQNFFVMPCSSSNPPLWAHSLVAAGQLGGA